LLKLAGSLGIGIELTLYPHPEGTSSSS
jgi:hypothetical protein